MLLPIIITALFLAYAGLIIYYWRSWNRIPVFKPSVKATTRISVVVPARNEEHHIENLLNALRSQTYPAEYFEVIVVDDQSTDGTAEKVRQFPGVKLISLPADAINSYKKKAITTGIGTAGGELLVTTDADCIPPPRWLETIAAFYMEKRSVAIAGPVVINGGRSFIEIFQSMDFMILQGITAATVHRNSLSMANGANLAYRKDAFDAVEGFSGIDRIASGDDMLLVHKLSRKFPGQYHYLLSPDAIVPTAAVKTIRSFFSQRIRWASKSMSYDDKRILPVLILVYLFNLSFLLLSILGFFDPFYWLVLLFAWIAKTLVELPFFYSVARFFNKTFTVKYFFFLQPFHIVYTIIAGIAGQMGTYQWKGRTVK